MRPSDLAQLPTLDACVHCGLCLPACPTYFVTGREAESPRGRIAALRALAEERTPLTPGLASGLDDCLLCRACESHCPSGISMEAMMAGYREQFVPTATTNRSPTSLPIGFGARFGRWLERVALRHVIARPARLRAAARLMRWGAPILRRVPCISRRFEIPEARRLGTPTEIPREYRPPETGGTDSSVRTRETTRGTVALVRGCVGDLWFRDELLATARVLRHNGYRVRIVGPACCGALHRHAGLAREAHALASQAAEQVLATNADHVVMESAGCAPALREPLEPATPAARAVAERVIDPLGLLAEHGWRRPTQPLPGRWIVAPACHHRHGPIRDAGVRSVLQETLVEGYMELPLPELCCGAAGFYSVRRPRLSRQIGLVSRERFDASGASGLLAGNPGCLLRWDALLAPRKIPVLHPVAALDRAYRLGGDYRF